MNSIDIVTDKRLHRQWLRLMGLWETFEMNYDFNELESGIFMKREFYNNDGRGFKFVIDRALITIRARRDA